VNDLLWFGNQLPKDVPVLQKDIFQLSQDDLKGYDQVIFLAGLSNDPMADFDPGKNFIYNASAPAYLCYLAKRAGVQRFIYAGSCSVYGYTVNELYNETSPAVSHYPYGISKLQGEQAVMQMMDKDFSVICFRQGTVSGYSPRMRLDLVVNTMFKTAISTGVITVNNPSIWRPVFSILDAVSAYTRAIEANEQISGIFNVASGNYTLGEIGDIVRGAIEKNMKREIGLSIKHVQDLRNYKVTCEKAESVLSIKPRHGVESIVLHLIENLEKFKDFDNPKYYNIQVFKSLAG
jgi:nucleoside-diphosphate-sugar epimerase